MEEDRISSSVITSEEINISEVNTPGCSTNSNSNINSNSSNPPVTNTNGNQQQQHRKRTRRSGSQRQQLNSNSNVPNEQVPISDRVQLDQPILRPNSNGIHRRRIHIQDLINCPSCPCNLSLFRCLIILIFVLGICCTLTGTGLGAMSRYYSGNSHGTKDEQHFTLSLLMIGVGVVLLTVSAIAWKMTEKSEESGVGAGRSRVMPSNSNPIGFGSTLGLPPSAMCREPPPSYSASMQEYRLRLLLYERSNPSLVPNLYCNPPPPYYLQRQQQRLINYAGVPLPHPPPVPRLYHPHHHRFMFYRPGFDPAAYPMPGNNLAPSGPPSYRSTEEMRQASPTESNNVPNQGDAIPTQHHNSGGQNAGSVVLCETMCGDTVLDDGTLDEQILDQMIDPLFASDGQSVVSENNSSSTRVNVHAGSTRTYVTVLHACGNGEKQEDVVTIVQTNVSPVCNENNSVIVTVTNDKI